MQRFRPNYYEKFTCTADRCPRTCCQEWKIPVDEETEEKWQQLNPPEGVKPRKKNLGAYLTDKEETRVIALDSAHHCPFLSEQRLCRLVMNYGDTVLSETCAVFPREVHLFKHHEEETLMPCCPAVVDLWKAEEPLVIPEIPDEKNELLLFLRRKILLLLEREEETPEEALLEAFYILLDLKERKHPDFENVKEDFSEKSLEELLKALRNLSLPGEDTAFECNEILQDLAVNYQKEGLYTDFLEPLLSLSERISEGELDETMEEKWEAFQKSWKTWQGLIRNFLINEIFSDLVSKDSNLESLLLRMEWIALTYAGIRQSVFLRWLLDGEGMLSYETVREAVVVLTRMTGYEEEDIREYLENSFETPVWEWGYFALILSRG